MVQGIQPRASHQLGLSVRLGSPASSLEPLNLKPLSWLPPSVPSSLLSFVAQVPILVPWLLVLPEFWFRKVLPRSPGPRSHLGTGSTEDMGKSMAQCLRQLDIRKSIVGLATGAGAIYLLYKAIRAGIKCKPPLYTASPICIARECPSPGERAVPQEAAAPEAAPVGNPEGDSFKFLSPLPPSSFSTCRTLGKGPGE